MRYDGGDDDHDDDDDHSCIANRMITPMTHHPNAPCVTTPKTTQNGVPDMAKSDSSFTLKEWGFRVFSGCIRATLLRGTTHRYIQRCAGEMTN